MKKKRKVYLSCKSIKKAEYQRLLNTRYNLIYEDSLEDADFFVMPVEKDGLTDVQKSELRRAEYLGLRQRLVRSDSFYNDTEIDVLKLDDKDLETGKVKAEKELEEDVSLELELI